MPGRSCGITKSYGCLPFCWLSPAVQETAAAVAAAAAVTLPACPTDHILAFLLPRGDTPQWWNEVETWGEQNIVPLFATEEKAIRPPFGSVLAFLLFASSMGLLFCPGALPAETAVIRMVDEHENTGVKYRFKQGWKLGWNRRAFRVWLVDLIIGAPAAGIVLSLIGLFSYF